MTRWLAWSIVLGGICLGASSMAAEETDCREMWKKADLDKDGALREAESERYLAALRVRNLAPPADGKFTPEAFMEACKADAFLLRTVDAGAPLKGETTLTETQARDRAMAFGVTGLADMGQDKDGIWRGRGMLDGKAVKIAVDYKGNVVIQ